MRLMIIFIFGLLCVDPVTAQVDPDPDGIGIYFDEAATQNATFADSYQQVHCYLVATHLSQVGGIAFWEARVRGSGNICDIYGTVRAGGYNSWLNMPGNPNYLFSVYFINTPYLPTNNIVVLADVALQLLESDDPCLIYVTGYSATNPVYQIGSWDNPLHDLYPSSGNVDLPVAAVNGSAPIASRSITWSEVKNLYR